MNLRPCTPLTLALVVIATTACTTGTTVSNFVPSAPRVTPAATAVRNVEPAPPVNRVASPLLIRSTDQGTILCTNPAPIYPPMSQKQGEEGKVLVNMELGPDGALKGSKIMQSSGYARLDRAALQAVANTRCDVFLNRQSGAPASVWTALPFIFRLAD